MGGMKSVVILGSGMAAWGAYDRLESNGLIPTLYDAKAVAGGHTASYRLESGFVFDDGPHISFTKHQEIIDLFEESVDGNYVAFSANVDNYYEGTWVEHPAIVNLYDLPPELVDSIINDFKAVHGKEPESLDNYMQWLIAAYGKSYAEKFPAKYGMKYHTCPANVMNLDWMGPRLYQPDLDEVIRGAKTKQSANAHYIKEFRYPTDGGFQSYLDKFIKKSNPLLSHEAVSIDPKNKLIRFSNGVTTHYDELISSVPLPIIIPMFEDVPDDVSRAAKKLSCSQCVLVNLGIDRDDLSPAHWRYVYDLDLASVRLSFPHMFSPTVAPPGHGAIQIEVYFSDKYKPFDGDIEKVVSEVIENLRVMRIIKDSDNIVFQEGRYAPWGNIIFDLDTNESLRRVHAFLDENNIKYCGRYGDWAYIWTDESYLSGQMAAQRVLDGALEF